MNKRKLIPIKFLLTALILSFLGFTGLAQCGSAKCSGRKTDETGTACKKKEDQTSKVKLPKLVDLGASKCLACKKLAPILDELKKDYAGVLEVEFIDVWKKENKAKAEKYKIEMIPTQIYFDADGKELWRHVGFMSKEDILAKWKKFGYDFEAKKKVKSGNKTK